MRCTLLHLHVSFPALLFILVTINLVLSVGVAMFIGSKRIIGFWGSFFISFIASAIIGLIVTLFYQTKKQQQIDKFLHNKFYGSESAIDEIQQLKILRQSGIISKTEFDNEIDRLLNL